MQSICKEVIDDYWHSHYLSDNSFCSLCGNTGIIDTRETAVSYSGVRAGRLNWCFCPNGQILRRYSKDKNPPDTGKAYLMATAIVRILESEQK